LRRKACLRKKTFKVSIFIVKIAPSCRIKNKRKKKCKPKLTYCRKRKKERSRCCCRRRRRRRSPIFPLPARCVRKRVKPAPMLQETIYRSVPIPLTPAPPNNSVNPIDPRDPIDPVTPVIPPVRGTLDKECCGNLLIQGNQAGFNIWEGDADASRNVLTIAIYSSQSSTEAIPVEIEGAEQRRLDIPPGNTVTFIGHNIKSVSIPSTPNVYMYAEGKYVISATLPLRDEFAGTTK